MKNEVEININKRKITKKFEEVARKKYSPTYISSEQNGNELPYSPHQTWYTPENSMFVPENNNLFYGQLKEDIPFGYHKIQCYHCENVITVPMGYSLCPECKNTICVDKNTVFLN